MSDPLLQLVRYVEGFTVILYTYGLGLNYLSCHRVLVHVVHYALHLLHYVFTVFFWLGHIMNELHNLLPCQGCAPLCINQIITTFLYLEYHRRACSLCSIMAGPKLWVWTFIAEFYCSQIPWDFIIWNFHLHLKGNDICLY